MEFWTQVLSIIGAAITSGAIVQVLNWWKESKKDERAYISEAWQKLISEQDARWQKERDRTQAIITETEARCARLDSKIAKLRDTLEEQQHHCTELMMENLRLKGNSNHAS